MKFNTEARVSRFGTRGRGPGRRAGGQSICPTPVIRRSISSALDEVAGRSYFSEMVANAGSTTTGALRLEDLSATRQAPGRITLSGLNTFAAGSPALDNLFGGFGAAETNATMGGGTTQATGNRRLIASSAAGAAAPEFATARSIPRPAAVANFQAFLGQISGECTLQPLHRDQPERQLAYTNVGNGSAIGLTWGFPSRLVDR